MPRFAANLSLLFTELPYLDRFQAAADAGFTAVEILFPYDMAAKETRRALLANGLELVLINAPPPNYTGGQPGYAAVPGGEARFQSDIRRVLRYADVLRPGLIHIMSGYASGSDALNSFVQNLQWAADSAPLQKFTIEPLNPVSQPDYFLNNFDLASEVLDRVNRPNVGLQYDSFHAHMIHGDAQAVWEQFHPRVIHAQIGAAPDRSEPGRGLTDFQNLFSTMDASGYTGWVSAEYTPSTSQTSDSLDWMQP
ncbi:MULTISPECIES: hydroxypyruvate isomerase family protein [unclassified Ruegeria]|uniref:hydroxypyruvate isomerase family protein n=1 Tax=unclassified Ruegeria TaxID=2625375 RepID=UPI0014894422|nr:MULTISPECIES: TIM barrel protein [unclassified Ruegeria]NOD76227.1 TIM barrel protein [Ruegeria sp. HKCCD4332]NOD90184.1 TIM barrel protein [Ruegeria sp. HKCCD4318]NOE15257.1 TIM barrel protein [Ruegeria sp. HKCCD4318-2]NOG10533.1 TIM barrel protein [Ruegeria sp. HKCCD4315]